MQFNPPLSEFSDQSLIDIIEAGPEQYQQEYIDQAKAELKCRKLSEEEMVRLINAYYSNSYIPQYRQTQQEKERLEANRLVSYTLGELVFIAFAAPFILIGRYVRTKDSLSSLWAENLKLKFWQRLLCLIAGVGIWYLILKLIYS